METWSTLLICERFFLQNMRSMLWSSIFRLRCSLRGLDSTCFREGGADSQLATAAYLNLSIAAATVLPAVLTGLLAWQFALEQKAQRAFAMASACSNVSHGRPGGYTGSREGTALRFLADIAFRSKCWEWRSSASRGTLAAF
jgi:hypothetical protein